MVIEWFFADEYTAGVDREIIGKLFDHLAILKDVFGKRMMFVHGHRFVHDGVYVRFGQTNHFAELTDDGLALEGIVCGELSRMFFAISFEDVIGDIIAIVPREVDVKIRW